MQAQMKKSKWTSREIMEQMGKDLYEMRYILTHSRHQVSKLGNAPNQTVSDTAAKANEVQQKVVSNNGVLRFDAQGARI